MRRGYKHVLSIIIIVAMLLTGCSSGGTTTDQVPTTSSSSTTSTATNESSTSNGKTLTATISDTSTIVVNTEFTASDLEVGYEESAATMITFDGSNIETLDGGVTVENGVLTINEEGTYVLSGNLEDGQVVIDAEDTDKVQLVLNGVSIACSNSAPIYIKNADKVFITLAEGTENTLTDGSAYVQSDENTVDGVIFSKADLTFNGEGTLSITANYKHGIVAKNELSFTGGTYNITAIKDAINGNEGVKVKAGSFTLSAETGNGISAKNSEDTTKGFVYICGGEINITNCVEGIEGTAILVEGGTINLTSQDDGFNASNGSNSASNTFLEGGGGNAFENDTNCYISISGGTISIDASGDGIDSNGSLYVSGGSIYVSGPSESGNGGLDYNGTADITGGTIVVAGSTGMAQGFSDTSTQYSLLNNFSSTVAAGTEVILTDADGNVIISFTPNKQYQSVVISTPELVNGQTYTLTCGEQTADITLSSIVTSNGQQQMGGQRMGGQGMGKQNKDGMEDKVR
ncbi:MAG: carbohydrate-binding domain-containing protein [Herbinix sp.]|nr:carbohydrate-binding domain-containing protein [Herbinix sp.]